MYPRTGKFPLPWSSCHIPSVLLLLPKHEGGSGQVLLGTQGGSPVLGAGAEPGAVPCPCTELGGGQGCSSASTSGVICVPPSPGTAFPTHCEWHPCPFTLSVPRCHSRAAGSHLIHRVVFGGSGEGNPLYPCIHGISDRILSQGRAEGEGMELRVQEGSLPS